VLGMLPVVVVPAHPNGAIIVLCSGLTKLAGH
jgi:hypothetical protein